MINETNAAIVFQRLPARHQSTYLGLLALEQWTKTNRMSAVQWLGQNGGGTAFEVATVTRGWTRQDDGSLSNYVSQLPAGVWRDQIVGSMAQDTLGSYRPDLGFTLAATMSPGEEQVRVLKETALKWADADVSAVVERLNQFSDPGLRETIVPYVANGYAMRHPEDAANWLLQVMGAGDKSDAGLTAVFQTWLDLPDAPDAQAWVETITDEATRGYVGRILAAVSPMPGE